MDFLRREIALKFHVDPSFYSLILKEPGSRKGVGCHRNREATPYRASSYLASFGESFDPLRK